MEGRLLFAGESFWSIDFSHIDKERGREVAEKVVELGLADGYSVIDPSQYLTFGLDAYTARALERALAESYASEEVLQEVAVIRQSLHEWLASTVSEEDSDYGGSD